MSGPEEIIKSFLKIASSHTSPHKQHYATQSVLRLPHQVQWEPWGAVSWSCGFGSGAQAPPVVHGDASLRLSDWVSPNTMSFAICEPTVNLPFVLKWAYMFHGYKDIGKGNFILPP